MSPMGELKAHTRKKKIYKCLNKITPLFTWDYYNQKSNHYNLRRDHLLNLNKCRTRMYGINKAVFKGGVILSNLPNHFKEARSLTEFQILIREWTQFSCTCCTCYKLFHIFFPNIAILIYLFIYLL